MKGLKGLFRSTFLLTIFSLTIRLISLFTQSRISAALGAEGIGLLQLSFGVQILTITIATSGVRYAATRLLSAELGMNRPDGIRPVLRSALIYALSFSVPTALALFGFAVPLSRFAGDERIAQSLRCMAPGLPCLSVCSVFNACFSATGRAWKSGFVSLCEQLATTLLLLIMLPGLPPNSFALGCSTVGQCIAAGDYISMLIAALMLLPQLRGLPYGSRRGLGKQLRTVSLPIAFSSYARSALSTLRHMLIPKALRRGGVSASAALSVYGTISGMALPVLGFASVFFSSLSELLIPELTQLQIRGCSRELNRTNGRVLTLSLCGSSVIALILFLLGPMLGKLLYQSSSAGEYIRLLAPIVIVQYSDSVVDGMLKGLGLQLRSMYINISDAALTLIAVWLLLPRFGAPAYIAILYGSECFNFLLSLLVLRRHSGCRLCL